MATGDAAQGVMSVEQAAKVIRQRLYLQSADVLGICTANTLHELRRHLLTEAQKSKQPGGLSDRFSAMPIGQDAHAVLARWLEGRNHA